MKGLLLLECSVLALVCFVRLYDCVSNRTFHVPDEQRLYRDLMWGYENSVRPVVNANNTVLVHFQLTLNQITDLDERSQVLTTNVFIDQTWTDENLMWDPGDYNNIRTLRLPDTHVWLPDTFLFNNADDGSTGFMKGMYVLINYNGTVLWPVPVKLKSACKVDIRYFPFDDQYCEWRFGSWIYSGSWIDFSLGEVDLKNFIDNSEWELLKIEFQKRINQEGTIHGEDHSDLHFTLHIRRRTLYYIFNIIAPCVMLSVLTLLTFWLPTTSGEKISLGLSVFLAFSMFMLLIAEEVPATSESVPLIGIYLTTVMTMTSVSVIMAVMVINLYNRGSQAVHAPKWMRVLILEGLSRLLCLKHDIEKITDNIKLDKDEEAKYTCVAHPPILSRRSRFRKPSVTRSPPPSQKQVRSECMQNDFKVKVTPKHSVYEDSPTNDDKSPSKERHRLSTEKSDKEAFIKGTFDQIRRKSIEILTNRKSPNTDSINCCYTNIKNSVVNINGINGAMPSTVIPKITVTDAEEILRQKDDDEEDDVAFDDEPESPVWIKRDSVIKREKEQLLKEKKNDAKRLIPVKVTGNRHKTTNRYSADLSFRNPCSVVNGPLHSMPKRKSHTLPNNNQIPPAYSQLQQRTKPSLPRTNTSSPRNKSPPSKTTPASPTITNTNVPVIKVTPSSDENSNDNKPVERKHIPLKVADVLGTDDTPCPKKIALLERRQIVVEWQTIATVIDRLLFWIFLAGTLVAYIVILFVIPYTKPKYNNDDETPVNYLYRSKSGEMVLGSTVL